MQRMEEPLPEGASLPNEASAPRTSASLMQRQLSIFAHELSEHFHRERELQRLLDQRMEQLREMQALSSVAQEEERQWIAMEVHDRVAQLLASVSHQLQTLESMTRSDAPTRQVAARASSLLREAIQEARNLMNDLYPPLLETFGVLPLMEEELRRFQEETGCQTNLQSHYPVRLSHEKELVLYRVFREAVSNVRRHAHATAVVITLQSDPTGAKLSIQDNGAGFPATEVLRRQRMGGLRSMQRRAEMAGGSCTIESIPGRGATVEVWFPGG